MPRTTKTTATKPRPKKSPTPPPTASGFIDAALMEQAIKLRQDGLTMKEVGAKLGVKATGYLAKKIKEQYGADTLARPVKAAAKTTPAKEA